jgi:DNA-binding transcriptional LysR family regulator
MDVADLKIFEAVARLGGMNRAAEELNTVQSNITTRIKTLEADIGCSLFERRSRGVALTAAGRRLLPYAVRAMRLIADARCAARDDGSPRGLLTIGSLETTAALRLTPLLAGYASMFPQVDLVLRTGTTRELIAATLEQGVDGAFVCGPVGNPNSTKLLYFAKSLACSPHPVSRHSTTRWERPRCRLWCCAPGAPTARGWKPCLLAAG